ncbi:MAG TPA: hypothetical protein VLZ83_11445 [Edaphocola sp.]|nr:hypothetical protein [Edaphocola sp.]
MNYQINQKVHWANKKVLIVGTKDEPYKPTIDPYNRAEIKSEKDYLIFILDKIENEICHYSGQTDVYENEIENIEW